MPTRSRRPAATPTLPRHARPTASRAATSARLRRAVHELRLLAHGRQPDARRELPAGRLREEHATNDFAGSATVNVTSRAAVRRPARRRPIRIRHPPADPNRRRFRWRRYDAGREHACRGQPLGAVLWRHRQRQTCARRADASPSASPTAAARGRSPPTRPWLTISPASGHGLGRLQRRGGPGHVYRTDRCAPGRSRSPRPAWRTRR